MEYRALEHVRDFEEAFALEVAVWGLDPRDAVPINMLRAIQHGGGALIGAYDGERLIGIALAFPARSDHGWILWSHMTGIDPDYQGRGIGFDLKREQRAWALANGFEEIRWTFDPLQRGNANFNLHRLGASAAIYHVNFYGVMADAINHADVPSDRVESIWRLRDPRVEQSMIGAPPDDPTSDRPFLLIDHGLPESIAFDESQAEYLAQIPARPESSQGLLAWRLALREALIGAFARGYVAVDFTRVNAYLLRRS